VAMSKILTLKMKKEKSKNYITWPQKGAGNATMDMIGRFIAYRFMC
jgi:hypothetical protein